MQRLRLNLNPRFRPWFGWCLAACLAGMALQASAQPEIYGNPSSSAFIPIPKDADDWTRHFRIGTLVGMNISANFSMNGNFNVNRAPGVYDNGYVRTDNTGNAFGQTGYWGYDNPQQYDGAHTLIMQANTSFSASDSSKAGSSVFPGFDMAYGDNLWYWKHARVGWELGFDLLPIDISAKSSAAAFVNQTTYTFDTGGIIVPGWPDQGYQGGFNRAGEPTISTNFTSSTAPSLTPNGSVTGTYSLDVMLYTLRLGPSFYWDLTDRLGMSLGAGPAVGVVSGNYKFDEIVTASSSTGSINAHNQGQISGTELVYGGYVNAALMYHVVNNGDIYISAQYMPMSDATISGGGREGRLNLGGQLYFSIGVSWPF